MNKTDIKTIFKNYLVLIEAHNEQKRHISEYFQSLKIRTLEVPLFTADYTFMIMPNGLIGNDEPLYFGNKFLIERKSGRKNYGGGFAELKSNLTSKHKQFKDEFDRMQDIENVVLLIENAASTDDILKTQTRGRYTNVTFLKSFNSFIRNRNFYRKKDIKIVYSPLEKSGETVMKLIFNYLTEIL